MADIVGIVMSAETKVCTKCKKEKLIDTFGIRKASPDGRAYLCNKCRVQYFKEYRIKNKEKIKQFRKEYRIKNIHKLKETNKKYYEKVKEIRKEKDKKYRIKNKVQRQKYFKKYRIKNKEKIKAQQQRPKYKKMLKKYRVNNSALLSAKQYFHRKISIRLVPNKLIEYKKNHILLKRALKSSQST